jgi:quercetin dioxygenase-like cupin family protein
VEGIAIGPEGGERVGGGVRNHRILAELPQFEVVELRFSSAYEVPPHTHADFVDSFFVLEGEAEFTFGGEVFRAPAGSFVAAPPGVEHGFRNATQDELRMLNVHAPHAGFAEGLRRG